MSATKGSEVHFDPYAHEVHDDPYPYYARLRKHAPRTLYVVRFWTHAIRQPMDSP